MWKHHGTHIDKKSVVIIADKRKILPSIALSTTTVMRLSAIGNRVLSIPTAFCVSQSLKPSMNTSTAASYFTVAPDFTASIATIVNCLPFHVNAGDYAQAVMQKEPYYLLNTWNTKYYSPALIGT